ncbi:hypothetical protein JXM83_01075 [Candidatus Woesearchaeota archaeon]|nr:hypothetical protein [Candidatus Woesearchaeota archaeon]
MAKKRGRLRKSQKSSLDSLFEFPLGIRFLVIFSLISSLLFLILAIKFPYLVYFGFNIEGSLARIILSVSMIMYLVLLFGLIFVKRWVFYLSIFWYVLSLVGSFCSLFFLDMSMFGLLSELVFIGLLVVFLINGLVLWYLVIRRDFFLSKKKYVHSIADKFFIFFLIFIFIVSSVFGIFVFMNVLGKLSYAVTDYGAKLLDFSYVDDGINFCQSAEDVDVCLLSFSVISRDNFPGTSLVRVCELIQMPFYRYVCFEGLDIR